jgi:hypothetical protein
VLCPSSVQQYRSWVCFVRVPYKLLRYTVNICFIGIACSWCGCKFVYQTLADRDFSSHFGTQTNKKMARAPGAPRADRGRDAAMYEADAAVVGRDLVGAFDEVADGSAADETCSVGAESGCMAMEGEPEGDSGVYESEPGQTDMDVDLAAVYGPGATARAAHARLRGYRALEETRALPSGHFAREKLRVEGYSWYGVAVCIETGQEEMVAEWLREQGGVYGDLA